MFVNKWRSAGGDWHTHELSNQVKDLRNGEVINERTLLCDPVIVAFQNDIVISVSFGRYAKVIYGYFLMRNGLH